MSVDALQKCLEKHNTDPDITNLFADLLLYIAGEVNDLPQCPNLALHSNLLFIGWPYIILGFIHKSLAHTQQKYFTHMGSKITVLKWDSKLITQLWKLIYGQ